MASALLVDYVLTVAVSVSSAVANLGSVVPFVGRPQGAASRSAAVALLTAMNLRGIRESGTAFAIPTYGFMIVIIGMVLTGLIRIFVLGDDLRAPSADLRAPRRGRHVHRLRAGLPAAARPSPPGCAALTGVEAISNGVPAFKQAEEPQRRHHAAAARRARGRRMLIGIDLRWPG